MEIAFVFLSVVQAP